MITIKYKDGESENPITKSILTKSIDEKFTIDVETVKGDVTIHNSKEGFSLEHDGKVIFNYNKSQLELFKTKTNNTNAGKQSN